MTYHLAAVVAGTGSPSGAPAPPHVGRRLDGSVADDSVQVDWTVPVDQNSLRVHWTTPAAENSLRVGLTEAPHITA
ncbi:MAG: hypothetical protein OER95_02550 [Acidimicrobiia bacterium]|nr:hypothetical protein [Acidimicrobiia bacterium]